MSPALGTTVQSWQRDHIYNFAIPGACVKESDPKKSGVQSTSDVKMSKKFEWTLAEGMWPTKVTFDPSDFNDLDEKDIEDLIDA